MPLYVKRPAGWTTVRAFNVKKPGGIRGTWTDVKKGFIKKASGWTQFWPFLGPKIEFPLEITRSSATWPSTLTGKNYHWDDADTLTYKFQWSLTNTTDNGAWTDLMSYTTITNPATGSSNTRTFSITSANFSTTVRSKWFRFVVRAVNTQNNLTEIEYSNTVNISKSALVGTAGTVVIERQSAGSYTYLVTNNGTWSSTPESYSYQWQQLLNGTWTDISGATSISQNMNAFTGKDVRCKVFAVDDLGATSELPIISNSLFVDFAPPSVTSFTATGGISKVIYSYVVTSDNQFPTITLKLERLQFGGSYLQTNFVNLTPKTGTNVVEPVTLSGTYRATLTASDGINPDSSIVVDNLTVANLNRTNVAIAQTTTNLSGATNITFSKTGVGSGQTAVIGWTNGSGVQTTDVYWSGNYNGNDFNKPVSGTTQSSSFLMSAATGSANITADIVQKAIPQATISWNQTNAQSYKVTYRSTLTIAPGGSVDTVVTGNSSAASVSLIVNQSYATVRVLEVVVYEYPNQNAGQPTGSVIGNFTITPEVQVTLGATQDFTTSASGTITYVYPSISGISISNTTPFPGSATSISVSNSPPSNTGSVSWANGSNTSVANLRSVTGSGSLATQSDPTSLLTSGTFNVVSTGTATATIRAINTSKRVEATWTQANAQSYRVLYTVSGFPGIQTLDANFSGSNPIALVGTSSNTFTLQSVTVYPDLNQGGSGVTLSSTASAVGADRVTDTTGTGSVTVTPAPSTPTITYSNVTATSLTVSWSATNATSYNVSMFESISGNNVFTFNGTTATVVSPSGLAPNRLYTTTVTAINSVGTSNAAANQRTSMGAALTPSFGANTSTSGGFTGSVTNYNANYVWNISASVGSVSWGTPSGSTYPFTVSGLQSLQNSTVTVTTTRTDYDTGSNTTSGSSLTISNPPTGGSVSVTPTTGTAGSTTFTASPSGWSGTGTITYAYSWQWMNSSFGWNAVATGTTFTPTVAQNAAAFAWRVVLTASNGISPNGTATANFTVNNPPLPGTPTSLTATTNRNDGVELAFSGSTNADSYDIYWNTLSAVRPASTVTPDFPAVSSPYLDTGITAAASRQYWVRGKNAQGTSEWFPTGTGSSGVVGTRISAPPFFPPFFPFFPFFPPFFPFFPPFFPFFPPFFPFFPTFGVVTPTISGLSVSGTGRTGRTLSWTSTNQATYSIATDPSTALNGATGATATSRLFTGLAATTTYNVTVTVTASSGATASASTSFST